MRKLLSIAAAMTLVFAAGSAAAKGPCKDDHGKFIKCPAPAAAPAAPAAVTPAPTAKAERCKNDKGRFIKCPAPGAAPAATPAPAAKAPAAAKTAAAKPASAIPTGSAAGSPAGASAQCKDGTYSHSKQHSGACSHHGGVAKWLQ
jgi:hypothetical protein